MVQLFSEVGIELIIHELIGTARQGRVPGGRLIDLVSTHLKMIPF